MTADRHVSPRPFPLRNVIPELLPDVLCKAAEASRSALVLHAQVRPSSRHRDISIQGLQPWVVLVVRGHVGVWRSDSSGKRRMIRIAHRGDLISLQALRNTPAAAENLVGLDAGLVALWPGDLVSSLAAIDAGLAMDLLEHTLAGTARILERLDRGSFDTVAGRLARLLWQEQGLLFDTHRPLLSRQELADLTGATREMVLRVLRDMEAHAIVARVDRSSLTLLNPGALKAMAEIDGEPDPRDLEPCGRLPPDANARPPAR
jgi:CRP-like cAMP-binding protein